MAGRTAASRADGMAVVMEMLMVAQMAVWTGSDSVDLWVPQLAELMAAKKVWRMAEQTAAVKAFWRAGRWVDKTAVNWAVL